MAGTLPGNTAPALNPLPLKENEGGALNLTRFTGIAAFLVALFTTINGAWNTIFGKHAPTWAKPVVMIAAGAIFAVVAAADMLARGYRAGHRDKFVALPKLIPAKDDRGTDQDCVIVGIRVDP